MKPSDKKPTASDKSKPGGESVDRALRDANIPPEDLREFQEDLKKNRKRIEGAGENPYDNLLDDEG
jgi:hypothetical protein